MLDGVYLGIAHANGGGHACIHDGMGGDGHIDRLRQVHPTEHNARIRLSGAQRHFDPLATVQPHADGTGDSFDGTLLEHGLILPAACCFQGMKGFGHIYNGDWLRTLT